MNPRSPMSRHNRYVRGVNHFTFDARTSFALFAATSAVEPSRSRTARINTWLRATCPLPAARPYSSMNAASSRFHFDPPTRLGLSADRLRHPS